MEWNKIRALAKLTNTRMIDIANALGILNSNLETKCKGGKLTIKELRIIGEVTKSPYTANMIYDHRIITGDSLKEMLDNLSQYKRLQFNRIAVAFAQSRGKHLDIDLRFLNDKELSATLTKSGSGHHNIVPNFKSRLVKDKYTFEERAEIAKLAGCEYEEYFTMPNGRKIK